VVPLPALSVIIRTKDGKEYKGHLVKQDFLKVTFRPPGSKEEVSLFKSDVQEMVQAVNFQLLEKLKPTEAKEYYEYAVGLMAKQEDPEAQETALRLFLIAAYLEPTVYGFNGLMKMSEIARSGDEAGSFRAMAFLLDAVSDKNTLKKAGSNIGAEDVKARESFLKALEMLRRGKTKEALAAAEVKGVADYFGIIPGLMSYPEFVKLCKETPECTACTDGRVFCVKCGGKGGALVGGKAIPCTDCKTTGFTLCKICKGKPRQVKLTTLQLQVILQLELLNESDPKAKLDAPSEVKNDKWSALLGSSQIRPIPVLSLIYLTEFDPRKSVFKNGKWVEP
jgi:hypothetical protein